jgi:hypothetical protein
MLPDRRGAAAGPQREGSVAIGKEVIGLGRAVACILATIVLEPAPIEPAALAIQRGAL